ncbi:unnamed protein product [Rotaria sp. Silwood1]|nr:unnamed protein product [Rotaria sp. Silwood1]CAF1607540.1 unnamed protein product [Rotaria sp. Silwood1]
MKFLVIDETNRILDKELELDIRKLESLGLSSQEERVPWIFFSTFSNQLQQLAKHNLIKIWSKENLVNKDDTDIQYVRVNLSGSQLDLVIKNKNVQFRFVLYPMDLTHICCNSNYSFIITIKRKSKY